MTGGARRRLRAFLFDLDGTLVDSKSDLALSVNVALNRSGLSPVRIDRVEQFIGDGARKLMERALRESCGREPTDPEVDRAVSVFLEAYGGHLLDSTRFYPGVEAALAALAGTAMAIVTNKPERMSRDIIDGLGWAGRFRRIVGGDTTARRKPDPEPLQLALEACGVPAQEAMMVGDSPVDVAAGKAAGTFTCAVTGGYRSRAELEAACPDLMIGSVAELPGRLASGDVEILEA
jgi:phosphoglycolate phosphatase